MGLSCASGLKVPMIPLWSSGWCVGSTLTAAHTQTHTHRNSLPFSPGLCVSSPSLSFSQMEHFPSPPFFFFRYNLLFISILSTLQFNSALNINKRRLTGACSVPSSLSMLPLLFLDSVFCKKNKKTKRMNNQLKMCYRATVFCNKALA